jgi:hypothetical protein
VNRYRESRGPARLPGGTGPRTPACPSAEPQFEPSNSETCVSSTLSGSESRSTAKPWFIETISTLPVVRSFTGMVRAVVALVHLLGLAAEGERQHLVAEADAEGRHAGVDHAADRRHGIFAGRGRDRRGRSTGRRRPASGEDVVGGGRRRHDGDAAAVVGEQAQDVALDAVVDATTWCFGRPAGRSPCPTPRRSRPRCSAGRR